MKKKCKQENNSRFLFCAIILSVIAVAIFTVIKVYMSNKMVSPYIFSDEQSYFGMIEKLSNLQFGDIRNNHGVGVPIIYIPGYIITDSPYIAYHNCLIINSFIGSLAFPLVLFFCLHVLKMELKQSALVAAVIEIATSLTAYNNLVMSETINTFLYLVLAILLATHAIKSKQSVPMCILFGVLLGYMPFVKMQATVSLFVFDAFVGIYWIIVNKKEKTIFERNKLAISALISTAIFLIGRYGVFRNISQYKDQSTSNFDALREVLASKENIIAFLRIVCAEFGLFFVYTGIVPALVLTIILLKSILNSLKERDIERVVAFMFLGVLVMGHLSVTIIHANYVNIELYRMTVYSRYLDFLQPIVLLFGSYYMINSKNILKVWQTAIVCVSILGLIGFAYFPLDYFPTNTYSILFFLDIDRYVFIMIMAAFSLLAFAVIGFQKLKYVCLFSLFVLFGIMGWHVMEHERVMSEHMQATFSLADNIIDLHEETIVIDKTVDDPELMYQTLGYLVQFWARKNNDCIKQIVDIHEDSYIITDKLLPREVVSSNGSYTLYNNKENNMIDALSLFRLSTSTELLNENFVRVQDDMHVNLYLNDVKEVKITLQYEAVDDLENDVDCYINDIKLKKDNSSTCPGEIAFIYKLTEGETIDGIDFRFKGNAKKLIQKDNSELYLSGLQLDY